VELKELLRQRKEEQMQRELQHLITQARLDAKFTFFT
jgi:hypothetical protein